MSRRLSLGKGTRIVGNWFLMTCIASLPLRVSTCWWDTQTYSNTQREKETEINNLKAVHTLGEHNATQLQRLKLCFAFLSIHKSRSSCAKRPRSLTISSSVCLSHSLFVSHSITSCYVDLINSASMCVASLTHMGRFDECSERFVEDNSVS